MIDVGDEGAELELDDIVDLLLGEQFHSTFR